MAPADCWNWGKWDSKNKNERGSSLAGSLGLSSRYKWFSACFGCSCRPSTNKKISHHTLFQCIFPHRLAIRQSCRVAGLLLGISDKKCVLLKVTESGPPFRTAEMGATLLVSGIIIIFFKYFFFVPYSKLFHLPPLRFHCADGCWNLTQDRCNLCISSQTF